MHHRKNYTTGYELAAMNRVTGESIFVAIGRGSKSRSFLNTMLNDTLSEATATRLGVPIGTTRIERINALTGQTEWRFEKRSADGVRSGDWSIKFSGRTALEVDQQSFDPKFTSIYDATPVPPAPRFVTATFNPSTTVNVISVTTNEQLAYSYETTEQAEIAREYARAQLSQYDYEVEPIGARFRLRVKE